MIKPTVGRKVWYRPSDFDCTGPGGMKKLGDQPMDATVVAVWGDRMVNLLVLDHEGHAHRRTSVTLVQDDDLVQLGQPYAEWMPYQVGQAKKDGAA